MTKPIKYLKIIISILLFTQVVHAQKITLAELHAMSSNKNWETSNKFLLSKGWEYYDSQTGDDEHYNTITWSFEKSYIDDKKANGWVYIYSYDGLPNKVMYRFRRKEYYTAIKNMLSSNGYKLDDEEILNQKVIAKYSNPNYILELEYLREEDEEDSYSGSGSFTVYEITVYKKGGVYDPNNGKKQQFDDDGNLSAEYYLKDGEFNGMATIFNPDGTINKKTNYNMGNEEGPTVFYYYKEDKKFAAKYFGATKKGNKSGKWLYNIIEDDSKERNLTYESFVEGIKEGDFRDVQNESLIFGSYKNGLLEGKYKVYTDLNRKVFGFTIQTDTTKITKTSEGQFLANKKIGYWRDYDDFGVLIEEGNYSDSLRTGKWKFYYPKYFDDQNKEKDYSKKLYLIANYREGKLNGESIRYSTIENIEIACEDSTSAEKCYKEKFVELTEKANYIDDVLNGPYELVNKNNEFIYKGQYLNDKESGIWTIKNTSEVDSWTGETIEKGQFIEGEKEGKWERFDNENKIIETYHYQNNVLNGEQVTILNNNVRVKREFRLGELDYFNLFDTIGNKIKSFRIFDKNSNGYKCTSKIYFDNTILTYTHKVKLFDDEKIIPSLFGKFFEELPNEKKVLYGI